MDPTNRKRYWLTPPDLYDKLNREFAFDFDPCPYPLPENWNALELEWGSRNFVNPPFTKADGPGPTAFVTKAIKEFRKGKTSVLLLPVNGYIVSLLQNGAELRPLGRVKWREADTGEIDPRPGNVVCAVLVGRPNGEEADRPK